jgi:pyruvate dehydrogenase (quinone)
MKVGDFVVERLYGRGVRRIYGYPGDGIKGVIGALQRADSMEFIQVRHEEMAAFRRSRTPSSPANWEFACPR